MKIIQTEQYTHHWEIKDYNVEIDGRKFFSQPPKDDIRSYKTLERLLQVQEVTAQWLLNLLFSLQRKLQVDFNRSK